MTQLFSFLADYGDTLETAFHRPRIDASEGAPVIGNTALDEQVHRALQARFQYVQQHRQTLPFKVAQRAELARTRHRRRDCGGDGQGPRGRRNLLRLFLLRYHASYALQV
ncbi:MAG: hypothetical protein ABL878_16580 [Burkholderiales bacterium]